MNSIKLGSIVKISKGKKAETVTSISADSLVRFIQIDDLRNDNNIKYTPNIGVNVVSNDIVIAWDGANAGTVGYGLNGIIGSTLAKIEVNNDAFLPIYLSWYLKSKSKYLRSKCSGATIPHISGNILRSLDVPLLSKKEQLVVVQILDHANALRQKRKQAIDLLDEYLISTFYEMFGDLDVNTHGWDITTLSSVTKKVTDGTHQPPKFISEGIPFIFISNIVNNEITLKTKKFISEDTYRVLTKSTPIEVGDILYTTVGSYGNPAIVKSSEKFCFQRHIAHIKPDTSKINTVFLYGMLKSPIVKRQADAKAKGIAQKTLNLSDLKNIKVFNPPIALQNKFAEIVKKTELIRQKMLAQAAEFDNQFQALMQKYFSQNR